MASIAETLAQELSIDSWQVNHTLELFADGGTVPFVARYRKERTGGLDEVALRTLQDRFTYLTELEDRRQAILKSIDEQGKLTDDLKTQIAACTQKAELEDLYLPYKPKRRTRATQAREKGLEPLADWIKGQNTPAPLSTPLEEAAQPYIDPDKGVATAEDALQGAADIIAEEIAETAAHRAFVRDFLFKNGTFSSSIKSDFPEGTTQYENYRAFSAPVASIPAHNMLALRRGETEGILFLELAFDVDQVLGYLYQKEIRTTDDALRLFYETLIADGFNRLMKHTIIGDIRLQKKQEADEESIATFAANLRELLLASPAGLRPTLGIDPGFRTGCKVAVLDQTGKFLAYQTIFPHTGSGKREEAKQILRALVQTHGVELIAIGNGTAGRETDQFVGEAMAGIDPAPVKVMVNEAGASVYSASEVAIEEFGDMDLTVRGAISIGRRLQDPLAELVKIDPKSIGVGQYQHDVDQLRLRQKLEETVESCVNFVGVNLNTASKELLRFAAGITPGLAQNIVTYRNEHGRFDTRAQLLDVPRFGPKAFEQAAGFLRIPGGKEPLDNTAVHPERYDLVARMAGDLQVPVDAITTVPERLRELDLTAYASDDVGLPTLNDILAELKKPGRDPRTAFTYAQFRDDVTTIKDLQTGMILEGVVTNVTNFGAFVDIGVHRDGLVHVSQMANRYVSDPTEVVKVGQVVKVRVTEINEKLNRIGLSMKLEETKEKSRPRGRKGGKPESGKPGDGTDQSGKPQGGKKRGGKSRSEAPRHTLDDLVKKFNSR